MVKQTQNRFLLALAKTNLMSILRGDDISIYTNIWPREQLPERPKLLVSSAAAATDGLFPQLGGRSGNDPIAGARRGNREAAAPKSEWRRRDSAEGPIEPEAAGGEARGVER